MKNFFLLCLLTIGLGQIHAQITLERLDVTVRAGTPIIRQVVSPDSTYIPTEGPNQVWDYSNLSPVGADTLTFAASSGSIYPLANLQRQSQQVITQGNITTSFDRTDYYVLNDTIYGSIGLEFGPVGIPLVGITGGPTDSLNSPGSFATYSTPSYAAWFPMNYGDTRNGNYVVDNQFLLTAAGFGLIEVPTVNRVIGTTVHEISGWGALTLTNSVDQTPVTLDVLLMKTTRVEIDSFFLGGAPMTEPFLTAFGVAQGTADTFLDYRFYAKGYPEPVLLVSHGGSTRILSDLNAEVLNQITLDRSDFIAEAGLSIFRAVVDPESASLPTEGFNQIWDYTDLLTTGADTTTLTATSSDRYPLANLQIPSRSLIAAGNVSASFDRTSYFVLNDTSYAQVGVEFGPVGIPLLTITGGAMDSLNGLESFGVYANPNESAWFPMNYEDDTRSSNYVVDVQFLLTAVAFGLDEVPTVNKVLGSATQEVVGWGALSLTNPMDQAEVTHDVLLLKTTTLEVDSFFLGGAPMTEPFLTAFGVAQGAVDTILAYRFYAEGYPDAVLTINGKNGSARVLAGWEFLTTSTNAPENNFIPFTYYPNPASGQVNIEFEKSTSEPWMYSLYNSLGQQVLTHAVTQPQGAVNEVISLNKRFSAGNYFYVLQNGNRQVMSSGSLMIK